jgi:predicted DNA-binding antitoxin AbrB/MazE fold protein
MHERIEVVYENGVLRPVGTLPWPLQEHQHLTISIAAPTLGDDWLADANPAVTLEEVRRLLSKAPGTLAQMVHDERAER